MTIGILPNVNSSSLNRNVNSAISAQKPKKDGDKSAVAILTHVRQLGCVILGHRAAGVFIDFTEEQKSLDQFDECDSQKTHCVSQTFEKTKIHRLV